MPEAVWGPTLSTRNFRVASLSASSFPLALCFCGLTTVGFMLISNQFLHWFVIPVILCGALIGSDALEWLHGRRDTFDPVGILALLGVHFFFLTPLLHVAWDYWVPYVLPPPDWRPWLGKMAILNCLGLLVYRLSRVASGRPVGGVVGQTVWLFNRKRFAAVLSATLAITGGLQLLIYGRYGGIAGYIATYTEASESFVGLGWIFMIAENFPIVAMIGFAVYSSRKKLRWTWPMLGVMLVAFLILLLLFGGLRGSRGNTLWSLFWVVGIIHFWLRPIPKKALYAGIGFLVFFMYFYAFFKAMGVEGLRAFEGSEARAELEERTGRTFEALILSDLGRSALQALLLHNLTTGTRNYEYAWGRTYWGTTALLIPRRFWPDRPPGKIKEGTEAIWGKNWFSQEFYSQAVYGLAGETMLNFGPLAVPVAFSLLGFAVGRTRRFLVTLAPNDSRLLMLPFLIVVCIFILIADSDNILVYCVKSGVIPYLVITLSSKKFAITASNRGGSYL